MAPEPQFEPRPTNTQTSLDEVVLLLVPKLTDRFEVAGGQILTWQEIERTRPVTPLFWWRDCLERRGTIPNALEWCKQKKFILSGEASGWRVAYAYRGRVVARAHPDSRTPTVDVHFHRWSDE